MSVFSERVTERIYNYANIAIYTRREVVKRQLSRRQKQM